MLSTADERFDSCQRQCCIVALVGTVQRKEEVVVDTAKSAYGELLPADCDLTAQDAELVSLEGRFGANLMGERDQDLGDLRLLYGTDHQGTSLEDTALLGGNALHRGTQEPLVVKSDRCHDGDFGIDDVGGIPRAAHA